LEVKNMRDVSRWRIAVSLAFLVPVSWAPAQDTADVVEVTVIGDGLTPDSAKNDALRKALEQGGQVEISSHSNVENFELIRDSIYARANGIITDYIVLEEGDAAGGVRYCKIKAKVSKSAIASQWGEVQNMLDQVGRPGVAVYIIERIDGQVQDSSILESQIENRLIEKGFAVYAGELLRRKMEKESADATSEQNIAKMQAIAKDFETQIFITGTAQANSAGVKELAGEPHAMYNCDAMIKMYYTDTGQLLASESLADGRGGARGFHDISPQAGKKGLGDAATGLIERCYQNVMLNWATRITAGGELELEVEGVNLADAIKLKSMLQDISADKIKSVHHELTKGIAKFRIRAQFTANELSEYLVKPPFDGFIEVTDLKLARIQAKKVGS